MCVVRVARVAGVCGAGVCDTVASVVVVVNVALVSAACRAMASCGARRLARLGCRLARARWIGARSLGQGASLRRKRWCGRGPWVWCGVGEHGLESDGALRGTSGRGAVMRARGIIGPMRDALGADGGGRDDRRRDGGDLCSMTRKQEMSGWRGAWADRWMRA